MDKNDGLRLVPEDFSMELLNEIVKGKFPGKITTHDRDSVKVIKLFYRNLEGDRVEYTGGIATVNDVLWAFGTDGTSECGKERLDLLLLIPKWLTYESGTFVKCEADVDGVHAEWYSRIKSIKLSSERNFKPCFEAFSSCVVDSTSGDFIALEGKECWCDSIRRATKEEVDKYMKAVFSNSLYPWEFVSGVSKVEWSERKIHKTDTPTDFKCEITFTQVFLPFDKVLVRNSEKRTMDSQIVWLLFRTERYEKICYS